MSDTIDMAREVKMPYDFVTGEPIYLEKLKAFEALVRADEREACAKECDELAGILACHNDKDGSEICVSLRDTIRARGNT
jgi:hypothetical protein